MTSKTALVTVLLWAVTFALLGSTIGATIGAFAPGYYRSLFRDGHAADFNPLHVGVGLGATQGLATGVTISLAVLALLAWRDVRAARSNTQADIQHQANSRRSWLVHTLWGTVTTISLLAVSSATFFLGGIVGQQQLYQSWTDRKLDTLATILESAEFSGIEAEYSSAAQVYLTGVIKSDSSRDALHGKLIAAFGTDEANEMIWRVDVAR